MSRYSLATALLSLFVIVNTASAHEGSTGGAFGGGAWSYLPVEMPTPLSDMSVDILSVNGNDKESIILTGGCDSADGNVYFEADWGEGFACSSVTSKVYAFDPIHNSTTSTWTGTFTSLADMPRPRNRHASTVVNGLLCVFGGRDVSDALIAEVDCYDSATNTWSTPTSLPSERQVSDFTAFTDETKNVVYLVAGYDSFYTALDTVTMVDMSDMENISFSNGPSLKGERGDIDSAVVDSRYVYVSGGFTHENNYSNPLNTVEMFDLETYTWSDVDALNQERGDKQLVSLDGKVFALGGEEKLDVSGTVNEEELPELGARSEVLDTVEVLNPMDDGNGAQWVKLADMPAQLFRFAAAKWKDEAEDEAEVVEDHHHDHGYIFVLGGQVGYDAECKCFRTTDHVMVMDVSLAEDEEEADHDPAVKASASGATIVRHSGALLSLIAAGLIWLSAATAI
ncbi:hypothetical protein ACHAXH_000653 [Discostella pseudostelligera]